MASEREVEKETNSTERHITVYYLLVVLSMNLPPISLNRQITAEISERGYALVPGNNFRFSAEIYPYRQQFIDSWENLILDEHLKDGGRYRFRRYGRFILDPSASRLEPQPNKPYFQSQDYNSLHGGIERIFAPLLEGENQFLQELIWFDFSQLPIPAELSSVKWNTGVHQIRIIADPLSVGKPTPEGIHHDGEMFTIQHHLQRRNVQGGTFSVYDNEQKLLEEWKQIHCFDSVYLEDVKIMHGVSDIKSKNRKTVGLRDILLIDFDPLL